MIKKGHLFCWVFVVCCLLLACENPFYAKLLPERKPPPPKVVAAPDSIEFMYELPISKTYGDGAFTNAIKPEYSGTGAVTYHSSNPSIAWVDENSGEVIIQKAGDVVISAVKAADRNFAEARASYELKINKALLSVSADNKIISFDAPAPEYTYTISGFVNNDTEETALTGSLKLSCSYSKGGSAGSYIISVTLEGLASDSYYFTTVSGTLSVGLINQEALVINNPDLENINSPLVARENRIRAKYSNGVKEIEDLIARNALYQKLS